MNSHRRLHSIGVDHNHDNPFDTATATTTHPNDSADTEAIEGDRNRAIYMAILFSTLMIAYLSFCCFYHKRTRARQRIGDSVHSPDHGSSRDQRRSDNRAVLDESSNAASRAREDAEMGRLLEERRAKIRMVLVSRLVLEHDLCGDDMKPAVAAAESAASAVIEAQEDIIDAKSSCDSLEQGQVVVLPDEATKNHDTITNHSHNLATNKASPTTITAASSSSSSSCIDLKRISNTISNCAVTHHCNTSQTTNNASSCLDSIHHLSSSNNNSSNNNSEQAVLLNEECNICLSSFQVGDRIAWSRNNTKWNNDNNNNNNITAESKTIYNHSLDSKKNNSSTCRHIFHAECIERWLLVREGCPVCRRSYFDDWNNNNTVGENTEITGGIQEELGRDDNDGHDDDGDLERGDGGEGMNDSSSRAVRVATSARVVAIEE